MAEVYIGLGSNVGDKIAILRGAVDALAAIGTIDALSPLYSTEPVGYADQDWFLNACVRLRVDLSPHELLQDTAQIENSLGRVRDIPNGPRTIDLDLLIYEDRMIDSPRLTLPHPRMHLRRFVLEPLSAIEPRLIHPVLRKPVSELLLALPEKPQSVRLGDDDWWRSDHLV